MYLCISGKEASIFAGAKWLRQNHAVPHFDEKIKPDVGLVQYGANVRPAIMTRHTKRAIPQATAWRDQNAYPHVNDTQARSTGDVFISG